MDFQDLDVEQGQQVSGFNYQDRKCVRAEGSDSCDSK